MEMLPKNGKAQTRKELSGYKDEQMVVQTQNPFKTQMKSVFHLKKTLTYEHRVSMCSLHIQTYQEQGAQS